MKKSLTLKYQNRSFKTMKEKKKQYPVGYKNKRLKLKSYFRDARPLEPHDSLNYLVTNWDLGFCKSHNFVFDKEEQKLLLHQAKPCIYTDSRYDYETVSPFSVYGRSLKALIRKVRKISNMPKDSYILLCNRYVGFDYTFKYKKATKVFDPQYVIDDEWYSSQFTNCLFSKTLVNALRNNGFIVKVIETMNYASDAEDTIITEQAIAYGNGFKLGISEGAETYNGYYYARTHILGDRYGEFDKWSRCSFGVEKPKDMNNIDEINQVVNKVLEVFSKENYENTDFTYYEG